ncbi:unnamed protein product [Heligmosomoides polygyrus]|uniref:SAM domain-containing protein n=1 Tax=Heligmosomoides polygyrus TaxID=6339 RepID=A0A3P8FKT0_HELPZ|nr:unnamed protein product [Heligmosomoides polygyrus]
MFMKSSQGEPPEWPWALAMQFLQDVVGGSLADRAGLRDGDILDQLEGLGNLDINAVDRLLVTSRDKIELIVHSAILESVMHGPEKGDIGVQIDGWQLRRLRFADHNVLITEHWPGGANAGRLRLPMWKRRTAAETYEDEAHK